jgi:hypothetical protein
MPNLSKKWLMISLIFLKSDIKMPSTTFVLKEPKSKVATLVYMLFWFNNIKLKYSTGQKINPKYWNPSKNKQRAKETRQFSGIWRRRQIINLERC